MLLIMKKPNLDLVSLFLGIIIGVIVAGLCIILAFIWIWPTLKPTLCK